MQSGRAAGWWGSLTGSMIPGYPSPVPRLSHAFLVIGWLLMVPPAMDHAENPSATAEVQNDEAQKIQDLIQKYGGQKKEAPRTADEYLKKLFENPPPISDWRQISAHDTAERCERARVGLRASEPCDGCGTRSGTTWVLNWVRRSKKPHAAFPPRRSTRRSSPQRSSALKPAIRPARGCCPRHGFVT